MEGGKSQAMMIAEAIFKKHDADHNGSIDKQEAKGVFLDELKKTHATKLTIDEEQFNSWFDKADANHDGLISLEEATAFIEQYLLKKND